jgi:hypothetical protein
MSEADRALCAEARSGLRVEARWALRAAALPWVVSRVVVAGALAVARELVSRGHPTAAVAARVHQGLLGWDAGWYESITRHGYGGAGHASLRFFPLVPLLARAVTVLPGVGAGPAVVVVANLSALAAAAVLAALARHETADDALARRAAWLLCLAPPAFTFVMGYAEATFVALAAGAVLALRRQRWWWAAGFGLLSALARPFGVLVALAAMCEVLRPGVRDERSTLVARLAAVAGPLAGLGAFLAYVGARYGDPLAPLHVQAQRTLRGGFADPVPTLAHDANLLVHGHHLGTALHLPWALIALVLLAVTFRCWPVSYGALALAALALAISGRNLDGFERYALSAFPLVLAGTSLTASRRVERAVLTVSAAGLALDALLAFANLTVP